MTSRMALALATLGVAGLLTTGCAAAAPAAALADETAALQAVGVTTDAEPSVSPSSAGTKPNRKYLRKNTLHGEITVQGKQGPRTLVVQRGAVQATDGRTLTVESSDGFAQTWTLGEQAKVRTTKGDLKAGAQVGVAGRAESGKPVARLVVVTG